MKEKILIISGLALLLVVIGLIVVFTGKTNPTSNTNPQPKLVQEKREAKPSETSIEYTDPAGFSFSYPDNLSIEKNEIEDPNTYADLELFSKDVNGSIKLKIEDTKFTSLDGWLESTGAKPLSSGKVDSIQKKLGTLDALEVKTSDRLLLAALDQKILFTIEVPLVEEQFWMKVYEKLLSEFSFIPPEANKTSNGSTSSQSDVTFEGEEVVE